MLVVLLWYFQEIVEFNGSLIEFCQKTNVVSDSVAKEAEELVVDAAVAELGSYYAFRFNWFTVVAEVTNHVNEPVNIIEAEFAELEEEEDLENVHLTNKTNQHLSDQGKARLLGSQSI